MERRTTTADGSRTPSDTDSPEKKQSWLTRKLAGFYRSRETIRAHPLWGTLFAGLAIVVGVAAHEAYDFAKEELVGPDKFLVQMRDEQKQGFARLQENLDKLSGAIGSEDRQALKDVKGAVKALESNNAKLIDQLAMAKRENDSLRKMAKEHSGVSGGYDFILTSNSGVRIDSTTVLGLNSVWGGAANVSLTSRDKSQSARLSSGQSVSYTGAQGRLCKVSVLGVDSDSGSASFALECSPS